MTLQQCLAWSWIFLKMAWKSMEMAWNFILAQVYEPCDKKRRQAKRWRDDLDKYRREMIWQRTVQDRLTWRRHAEAFVQPRDTTAAQWMMNFTDTHILGFIIIGLGSRQYRRQYKYHQIIQQMQNSTPKTCFKIKNLTSRLRCTYPVMRGFMYSMWPTELRLRTT